MNLHPSHQKHLPECLLWRQFPASSLWADSTNLNATEHSIVREWQMNPFTTHAALVTELVEVFFKYIPETAYCMFPEAPFTSWILSSGEKSLDDLMLVNTVLALGHSILSQPGAQATRGSICVDLQICLQQPQVQHSTGAVSINPRTLLFRNRQPQRLLGFLWSCNESCKRLETKCGDGKERGCKSDCIPIWSQPSRLRRM